MGYSVVIRTLGESPYLENELREIYSQIAKPEKVLIFIPEGISRPKFQIGDEEYVQVEKGMMHQRLLPYGEISSEYILMLDDDVKLQPDSVEKLLNAMKENDAHLIGVDTFKNHKMPLAVKFKAAVANLVFPHFSQRFAFKIHRNGSFSYINSPKKDYYPSQSCAGNAMLWKTYVYKNLEMQDELWLDSLPFAFEDDMLESYKVYKNGLNLGVVFNSGIIHLDCKTASDKFRKDSQFFRNRTLAQMSIWWRTCYKPGDTGGLLRFLAACAFTFKMGWLLVIILSLSVLKFNFSYCSNFFKGISEGWKFVHSKPFRSLRPYVIR